MSLSHFILKQKLYKHSFVSTSIIALMSLIVFIISIFYIKSEVIFPSFLYYIFYGFSFGLYDVLKKKYMLIFFNTPYFMMSVIGVINCVIVLIFDVFLYCLKTDSKGVIIGFQNNIISGTIF